MSTTCFERQGSSSGRQLYTQLRYGTFYMHQYKHLVGSRVTAYTHACQKRYTVTVYTTTFLKMNPRFRNM